MRRGQTVTQEQPRVSEVIAECVWRAVGWVCDERANAVISTSKQVFRWRSTKWWQSTKAVEMKTDPRNHTWWKHKRSWHNRGCVRDKVATEWVGDEDWICKRTRCQAREDKKRFVTFALKSVNHSTIHRTITGNNKKNKAEDTAPRTLQPQTKPSTFVEGDRQCSSVETVKLRRSGSTVNKYAQIRSGTEIQRKNWPDSKDAKFMVEKKHRTSCVQDRRLRKAYLQRTQPRS